MSTLSAQEQQDLQDMHDQLRADEEKYGSSEQGDEELHALDRELKARARTELEERKNAGERIKLDEEDMVLADIESTVATEEEKERLRQELAAARKALAEAEARCEGAEPLQEDVQAANRRQRTVDVLQDMVERYC